MISIDFFKKSDIIKVKYIFEIKCILMGSKYMKLDLHVHTSGISRCCRIPAETVLSVAKNIGLDGIVLTNHYTIDYVKDGDALAFARDYIAEYEYTKQLGEAMGLKVFFGVEVTWEGNRPLHILLYGVPTDFVLKHPTMYDYSPKELYDAVKAVGGAVIQAHPFRNRMTVLPSDCLDGVEINCHPIYRESCAEKLIDIAHKEKWIVTCGGDFHADTYRPICATVLPDFINENAEIAEFLLSAEKVELLIHEPLTASPYRYRYFRDGRA